MKRSRSRRRAGTRRRQTADPAMICMASAAAASAVTALVVLAARPGWDSRLFDQPFGAYLLGGVGGLITTAAAPGWARRLGPGHPARVVILTLYRLLCSCIMGGMGYALIGAAFRALDVVAAEALLYLAAFACGAAERGLNMVVLGVLGFLAPREVNSPLL